MSGSPSTAAAASGAHEAAARRLVEAASTRRPCEPIRDLLPGATIDDAYQVAQRSLEVSRSGVRRVGRKIGLTSAAVQAQMGVDMPDFGVLLADMAFGDSEPIPADRLLQPRVEGEVAFVLGADLPNLPVTTSDVLRATEFVVAAIEVVDSRIRDWDISIIDTVADNASSGLFVLGGAPRRLTEVDLRAIDMEIRCTSGGGAGGSVADGSVADGTVVSSGTGAACLGHPVNAVVWLANTVAERGEPLRAGEVILSGSLGPLAVAEPGRTYEASFSGLGTVRAQFEA